MALGIAIFLLVAGPILWLMGACLRFACRLAGADPPGVGASIGWALFMGGSARGGAVAVRDFVGPGIGGTPSTEVLMLQIACYLVLPFFVVRLGVCRDTFAALRVHVPYLMFGGTIGVAALILARQLA
jgi:hypothetical protein